MEQNKRKAALAFDIDQTPSPSSQGYYVLSDCGWERLEFLKRSEVTIGVPMHRVIGNWGYIYRFSSLDEGWQERYGNKVCRKVKFFQGSTSEGTSDRVPLAPPAALPPWAYIHAADELPNTSLPPNAQRKGDIETKLRKFGLANYLSGFEALGVVDAHDFVEYVKKSDLEDMGMTEIEKRKFDRMVETCKESSTPMSEAENSTGHPIKVSTLRHKGQDAVTCTKGSHVKRLLEIGKDSSARASSTGSTKDSGASFSEGQGSGQLNPKGFHGVENLHGNKGTGHKFWCYPRDKPLIDPRWDTHAEPNEFCVNHKYLRQKKGIQEYMCLGHFTLGSDVDVREKSEVPKSLAIMDLVPDWKHFVPARSHIRAPRQLRLGKLARSLSKQRSLASMLEVDPFKIRFTHSMISQRFQNRNSLDDTIDAIKAGNLNIKEFPPMFLFEHNGFLYSLSNRRLFVLRVSRCFGNTEKVIAKVGNKQHPFAAKLKYCPRLRRMACKWERALSTWNSGMTVSVSSKYRDFQVPIITSSEAYESA